MSSAVQTNSPPSTTRHVVPTGVEANTVEADTIETLRVLAPVVDPLVESWKQGTDSKLSFNASRQFMNIQSAAANARVALERKFPELGATTRRDAAAPKNDTMPPHVYRWAQEVHQHLSKLETRIRQGYMDQECPMSVRDAVIAGDASATPTALTVIATIVASHAFSNFTLTDPRNARALGIRSDLSKLPLRAA
jgi:hypothetical protein